MAQTDRWASAALASSAVIICASSVRVLVRPVVTIVMKAFHEGGARKAAPLGVRGCAARPGGLRGAQHTRVQGACRGACQ